MNRYRRIDVLLLLVGVVLVSACDNAAAPPPVATAQGGPLPEVISGKVDDQTNYAFLKWKEGLAFMIVDGLSGGWRGMHSEFGNGQPDRRSGFAKTTNNSGNMMKKDAADQGYEWKSESPDGKTTAFTIDGVPFDMTKGSVFRIDMAGDKAIVIQIDLDLSDVQPNEESCKAFIAANPELSKPVSDKTKE